MITTLSCYCYTSKLCINSPSKIRGLLLQKGMSQQHQAHHDITQETEPQKLKDSWLSCQHIQYKRKKESRHLGSADQNALPALFACSVLPVLFACSVLPVLPPICMFSTISTVCVFSTTSPTTYSLCTKHDSCTNHYNAYQTFLEPALSIFN